MKTLKQSLFTLLGAFVAVLIASSAMAMTQVPEADSPSACKREKCRRWYKLSQKQSPNACKYESPCRRWYHVPEFVPQVIVLQGVNFDTASAKIKPESYPILDGNVATLQKHPSKRIRIVGHTDNRGSDSYNQGLSEKRAASVMNYFIQKGVSGSRMTSEGAGETQPLVPNTSKENMYQNRRIEIHVTN